jgi:hypothetical protein
MCPSGTHRPYAATPLTQIEGGESCESFISLLNTTFTDTNNIYIHAKQTPMHNVIFAP